LNLIASHHSSAQESGTDSSFSESVSADQISPTIERVLSALQTLKAQHAALLKAVQGFTLESNQSSVQGSPLPFTAEEEEQTENSELSPWLTTAMSRKSHRTSVATTISDSVHEWFDALDGAEEFVMDMQTPEGTEQPSRMFTNESRSSLDQQDASSVDTDVDVNIPPSEDTRIVSPPPGGQQVIHRTQLPAPPVGDEGSLFAILKKNVGKVKEDPLSKVWFGYPYPSSNPYSGPFYYCVPSSF
jgi:hypothetical protein